MHCRCRDGGAAAATAARAMVAGAGGRWGWRGMDDAAEAVVAPTHEKSHERSACEAQCCFCKLGCALKAGNFPPFSFSPSPSPHPLLPRCPPSFFPSLLPCSSQTSVAALLRGTYGARPFSPLFFPPPSLPPLPLPYILHRLSFPLLLSHLCSRTGCTAAAAVDPATVKFLLMLLHHLLPPTEQSIPHPPQNLNIAGGHFKFASLAAIFCAPFLPPSSFMFHLRC